MDMNDKALVDSFHVSYLFILSVVLSSLVIFRFLSSLYDVFYGPLAAYPGPKLWAFSSIPRVIQIARGDDTRVLVELHRRYGPVVRTGPRELSYTGGGDVWKDIYGFRKAGQTKPQKDPFFYGRPLNGVPGVIGNISDAEHGRQRKILAHSFSDKALKEQQPLLKKWSQLLRDKLMEKANGLTAVDMVKMYNCTTFDIMGDLTFSESLHMLEDSEYSPWVKTIFASIKNATRFRALRAVHAVVQYLIDEMLFKSKRVRRMAHEHARYTEDRVNRRLARQPEHPDLWTKIMDKDTKEGGLSLKEHHTNASLFMIAGTETTATALSGTTYYLLRNPHWLQKLVQEIRSNFATFDDITLEDLARLPYTHAVLMEGLRAYPPVPVALPRKVPPGGATIYDRYVPAGTSVGVNQFATYRMEEFFKNPDEFHPERWLGDKAYKDDQLGALEPFSVGPRNCLGKNLAWHEMRIILVTVLLHFDLELTEESQNWSDQDVFTLWEKIPLLCTLSPAVGTK